MISHWSKIIVLVLLSCSNVLAQQWYLSPVYHGRSMYSVAILDRTHVIVGGGNESNDSLQDIVRSTEGGMQWLFSSNQGGGYIRSMAFNDTLNGMAVGYAGKILKTVNGAESWDQVYAPYPNSARNFNKVLYLDNQNLIAFGGRNYGNDTIQTIIKSTDGGDTWNTIRDIDGRWLKGAFFINPTTGFAVGGAGTIIKTTDGGSNWTTVNSPVSNRELNAVYFINATTGYIVGGNFVEFDTLSSMRTILKTTDGGATWNIIMDEAGGWLTALDFLDQNNGYLTGDGAQLYKTTNGGSNWIRQTIPGSQWYSDFTSVKFLNENFGVVTGRFGEVFLYSNEALPEVVTLPATVTAETDTNATVTLRADINTQGLPMNYNFKYSTTPDFSSNVGYAFIVIYPTYFNSNSFSIVEASVNNFLPQTTYYYFVTGTSASGTVNGDTLSFFTNLPFTEFNTFSPNLYLPDSVVLRGQVNGFTSPVTLSFEYGTSPFFGNEIQANPATVSDNLQHSVSAALQNLPDGYYYYRLKGIYSNATVYGDTSNFLIGPAFQTLETMPASTVDLNSGTLNGFLSGFVLPATISFEYGNTPSLGSELPAVPSAINDNQAYSVSLNLSGLQATVPVYYRVKASTSLGVFFGEIMNFVPGFQDLVFETQFATRVTATSARVNAYLENLGIPANLYFEYGTTPALGSFIPANLSSVNDTLFHQVYADLTGLQSNAIYYYRLKAEFDGTYNLISPIRQVFTAEPEIPNWDFQNWETTTSTTPLTWNLPTPNFEQVPGVEGNALKIFGKNVALLGLIAGADNNGLVFYDGCPVNYRPDSLVMYLNYDIAPQDSAIFILRFSNNGVTVSDNFFFINGSSAGNYNRFAFPITYHNQLVPDTFGMVFAPWIFFNNIPSPQSPDAFISIDNMEFSPSSSAICNGDFEDWFTFDHFDLQDWSYPKHAAIDTSDITLSRIVQQSVFEQPGDYAAKIRNIATANNRWLTGNITALKDNFTHNVTGPSFAVSKRFKYFNGYYKYEPQNNDTAFFHISLFKNGQQVGDGQFRPSQTMTDYMPLDIELNYINDTIIPDSADIIIVNSYEPPPGGSVMYVDKLSFDGFWGSNGGIIQSVSAIQQQAVKVYPNPAKNNVTVELPAAALEPAFLLLSDINGRALTQALLPAGQTRWSLDVSAIDAGLYFLKILADNKISNSKIVVVK